MREVRASAPIECSSGEQWTGLVERDAEREQITGALMDSEHGRGRFVVLYGTAGVGRSSLLRASALEARERRIAVLEACGSEMERGYGFGVVRQLLEARIAGMATPQRRSLLTAAGPHAESALGTGSPEMRGSSASFDQIEGVFRLITRLAEVKPLLLAVDDLQWCDRPSLDFLCFLGHRATRLPVTIIAAWRRGEPGVRAGRLQALAGKPDTLFLSPAPLTPGGVRRALKLETGSEPDDEAVGAIHAQTGGQSFLVSALIRGLVLRDVPARADSRESIEGVTPEAVRRNVAARLGRHSQQVQRFAHAVAVLGDGSLARAAALAMIDQDKARGAADALVRAGILRDDSALAFAQPLLRAAVYDTLTSLEAAELHQRAAALLCEAGPHCDPADPEPIARHLLRCAPAGDSRFAEALQKAASCAATAGAIDDAQRMLQRALDEIDNPADRGRLLTRLSDLELRTADFPAAAAHATEAQSIASTPTERLVATLASAQAVAATSGCGAAVQLFEEESEHLGETDADVQFGLRAAAVVLRACADAPPGPAEDALAGVEDLLGETESERALLAGLASLAILTGDASATHINRACARVLTNRGEAPSGAISDIADYLACRAALLADMGDLVEHFLERTPQDGGAAETGGRPAYLGLRAQLALSRGELAEAEAGARAALTLLGDLPPTALHRRVRADLLAVVAAAAIERANYEEAEQALTELLGAEDGPSPAATSLRLGLALAQSLPTLEIASAAADGQAPEGLVAPGISWRPLAAIAHHAAGDCSTAVALAAEHLRHAEAWGIPSVLGRALTVRAVVDPGPERLSFVEEAVAVLEGTSAQLELASATVELGAALRRARRRRESQERLVSGADLAHRCGAHALAARARLELVSLGARPRRAAFSGVSSLTAAELRVARLAAAGLTNRAIAQELIVSVKTVSGQLTSVYRKLEVHDRAALVPAMREDDHPESAPEAVN